MTLAVFRSVVVYLHRVLGVCTSELCVRAVRVIYRECRVEVDHALEDAGIYWMPTVEVCVDALVKAQSAVQTGLIS